MSTRLIEEKETYLKSFLRLHNMSFVEDEGSFVIECKNETEYSHLERYAITRALKHGMARHLTMWINVNE